MDDLEASQEQLRGVSAEIILRRALLPVQLQEIAISVVIRPPGD